MTRSPVEVDPEMRLTRVLQMMIETRYKSFPVVENGRLAGVIAREDVLRAVRRAGAGELP
jgi:CBS domain-containing protein